MDKSVIKKIYRPILWVCLIIAVAYGLGRLYYKVTGGFTIGNITYELPYDSRWDIRPLTAIETRQLDDLLGQKFTYLGKGCQSYVFKSEDGKYVLKFFKYQRLRPQPWLQYLTFLPGMDKYLENKIEKKRLKLEGVFTSWKIAFEDLQPETGVVYVHLNKSHDLNKTLVIIDKMGFRHDLSIDNFEFLIQRKAKMLCATLDELMEKGDADGAKRLLSRLMDTIMSEYKRGYADNDNALMQNTGVLDGQPIHIDVGQFVRNNRVKNPQVYNQEIFNKTWKFRKWLAKHYPDLEEYLVVQLKQIIGEKEFNNLKPRLNKAEVGVISHQPDLKDEG